MRVILVHGISTDGEQDVDRLGVELARRGLPVRPVKYEPVNAISALWRRKTVARMVINAMQPGDAAVGHSFGCAAIFRAMEMGARFGPVVFFSAAMESKVRFPYDGMDRLLNVRHAYDKALSWGALIPGHFFGRLGKDGYMGEQDSRITEATSDAKVGKYWHTAPYFSPEYVGHWADRVVEFVR